MKIFKEGRAKEKPPISDFPSLATHIPVFSQQALNALKEVLDRNGQLLPLDCDEGEYFAFNVTRLCDAFDRNSSSFYELPGGGIIDVKKYVLLANRIKDEPIFKVPQTAVMDVFVNERFKNLVERNNLKGFLFDKVEVVG